MANFDRIEPRGDRRRVFDGGETDNVAEEEEGSRLPLLLVIGLLVVAAFGGVVWLAYTQGVARGRADAPRMLVAASPQTPGQAAGPAGSDTAFKGLKIYQQPAPADDEDVDSTPPPSPKAAAPVKPATTAAPVRTLGDDDDSAAKPVAEQTLGAPDAAAKPTPEIVTKPPRQLAAPASDESAPPAPPTQEASAEAPPAAAPAVSAESTSGPALQIGAYKSEDEANAAWKTFLRKHPMAGDHPSQVVRVDLGEKGVWFRLRLVGFADKDSAGAFCDKLKSDGGNCFPAK